ncbi:MAG TPA: hypothetical protein VFG78_02045 [Gemmatimonadota bacterium]|nr:hypothetical protein [Gemmatimonadota bacterium]
MSRSQAIVVAGLLALGAACASSDAYREAGAGGLDAGALALRRGEFDQAREALANVRRTCGESRLGRQALLLIAALEADPRNPAGDPDRAAALAGHWLTHPETFPWTRPVAETIYLHAVRAGGTPYSASGKPPGEVQDLLAMSRPADGADEACDATDWEVLGAGAPPELSGRPRSGGSPDEADGLRQDNARLREQVAQLEAELQRIRETLRP